MHFNDDIGIYHNFWMCLREGGKKVPGSLREGHNVFTTTGRNFLTKLVSWFQVSSTDIPYTQRRVRWLSVGTGTQLESANVSSLVQPVLATASDYLAPLQAVEFPTSTSVRFIKEFPTNEINVLGTPVTLTEAGLFADVSPAQGGNPNDGFEDVAVSPGVVDTILNPAVSVNAPIAYKAFEGLTKTVDFTLEIRWDFRFE